MDPGPKITWGVGIAFVATLRHHLDRPPAWSLSRDPNWECPKGVKIADSVDDHWKLHRVSHLLTLILEHCRVRRSLYKFGSTLTEPFVFFRQKDWTEHFVHGPCLCWDTPESRCKSKMIPSAPAASRYANSYQKETAPRPSRTCQREATKVNQHPQNFLGQGDTKLSFTEFFPKRKCHWNLMFHSLYVLQVENHVGHVCKYSTSSRYVYTIVQ